MSDDEKLEDWVWHMEPSTFKPELLGQRVSIQIFKRESPDSDTLVPNSMEKCVGFLENYLIAQNKISFTLRSLPVLLFDTNAVTIEVYKYWQEWE